MDIWILFDDFITFLSSPLLPTCICSQGSWQKRVWFPREIKYFPIRSYFMSPVKLINCIELVKTHKIWYLESDVNAIIKDSKYLSQICYLTFKNVLILLSGKEVLLSNKIMTFHKNLLGKQRILDNDLKPRLI
jgi:hypothetical protein